MNYFYHIFEQIFGQKSKIEVSFYSILFLLRTKPIMKRIFLKNYNVVFFSLKHALDQRYPNYRQKSFLNSNSETLHKILKHYLPTASCNFTIDPKYVWRERVLTVFVSNYCSIGSLLSNVRRVTCLCSIRQIIYSFFIGVSFIIIPQFYKCVF